MPIAGDLQELGYSFEGGSGVLFIKAGEDSTFNPGGFINADDENNVDGSGEPIISKQRRLASLQCTVSIDETQRDDMEVLRAIQRSNDRTATFTYEELGGALYQINNAFIAGDLEKNITNGTVEVTIHGNAKKL